MPELDDYSDKLKWVPEMRPPASFSAEDVTRYQRQIDSIVGTSKGKSIIKLAWAPSELRWRPYNMVSGEALGYTFPIFIAGWDEFGVEIAAPRWVLLERAEPEQYAPGWTAQRYMMFKGDVWDAKGPCPDERYTELRCHGYHDTNCCPCRGYQCVCEDVGCWGLYADPNEDLLQWIRDAVELLKGDSDIKPLQDARFFESPNAQRETENQIVTADEAERITRHQLVKDMEPWTVRNRVGALVPGTSRTKAGLIVSSDLVN